MTELARVPLLPTSVLGHPTAAVITDERLLLIGAAPEYADTPIKFIHQCDKFVIGDPPTRFEAQVDGNSWNTLLSFASEQDLDVFVRTLWAIKLAKEPNAQLSRYGQDHAPVNFTRSQEHRSAAGGGGAGCILASIVAGIIAVALIGGLVGGLVSHVLGGNPTVATSNNTGGSSIVNAGGGASADVSSCLQQSGFGSAGLPSAGSNFQDVSFPDATVSYFGNSFNDGSYQFQMIEVCTVTSSPDDVRSFFASSLPNSGWTQTDHFPYAGNPNRGCGDPYCWTKGSSPTRFASLEKVQQVGDDVVYELRLGLLP